MAGRLVHYDYHLRIGCLDGDELEQYEQLSRRIATCSSRTSADESDEMARRRLLIARARLLKKAHFKVGVAREIMSNNFDASENQRWLVYCDDTNQLGEVMSALLEMGIDCQEYTSAMRAAKRETLAIFEKFGGVLCSIHCLDEGINIPSITHALILASSVNPREHLQRRGRVLRRSARKHSATVFDVLVGVEEDGEQRVFRSEVVRARALAQDARNHRSVMYEIESMLVRSKNDDGVDFEGD